MGFSYPEDHQPDTERIEPDHDRDERIHPR